jgi:nucleoside-diphosphate-sugar epimerase
VTGYSGFIGNELVMECKNRGIDVVLPSSPNGEWRLGFDLELTEGQKVSHAVHLAHDFKSANQTEANVLPTIKAINELRASGTTFQCIVSSFSAGPHSRSAYGKAKFALENIAKGGDIAIVRPGLVIGKGGIWERISKFITRTRLAVIPGSSSFLSPSIDVKDLCSILIQICEERKSGLFYATSDPNQSFKDLIEEEFSGLGYFPIVLPIWLIRFGILVLDALRVRLPVTRDNVEGFLGNQSLTGSSWVQKGNNLWALN